MSFLNGILNYRSKQRIIKEMEEEIERLAYKNCRPELYTWYQENHKNLSGMINARPRLEFLLNYILKRLNKLEEKA